jgi:hypothetical protein
LTTAMLKFALAFPRLAFSVAGYPIALAPHRCPLPARLPALLVASAE